MDVLHHDLESIEELGFRTLDFRTESLHQVLVDDPVRRSEKSKNVLDEMSLVVVQFVLPVVQVRSEIDLLGSPE